MAPTHPVASDERIEVLDAVRGLALIGVLMVNLLTDFRVPLDQWVAQFHSHHGAANHIVDWVLAVVVEGKAFSTLSLLFGWGLAMQADRAAVSHGASRAILVRRLLVLLFIGVFHLLVIWNGDILALYALAGLIGLLFVRRSSRAIWIAIAVIGVVSSFPYGRQGSLVGGASVSARIAEALSVYSTGSYFDIFAFRMRETIHSMVPVYARLLPRTVGLFLLGFIAFRRRIFQEPSKHRALLGWIVACGLMVGTPCAVVIALSRESVMSLGRLLNPVTAMTLVPLALAYMSLLLLALDRPFVRRSLAWLSPFGRLALTNYLLQSLVFSFVFYGYGLGLIGKVGPATAALFGLLFCAVEVFFSHLWLRRFRFGPAEWLWRSATYGTWQPMRYGSSPTKQG